MAALGVGVTPHSRVDLDDIIEEFGSGGDIRFSRLVVVCERFFGKARIRGSHHIFKTPWQGDPRINLQKVKGGKAKPYQVEQVVRALVKLLAMQAAKDEPAKAEEGK